MRPEVLFPLFAPVTALPGIGPRLAKLFESLAGPHVVDLCWHLPSGLIDRRYSPKLNAVEPGRIANLIVVEENPLANMKVLYGTGAVRLNDETGRPERVGGVKYTIKDGIVYDAKQLLKDVEEMVKKEKSGVSVEEPIGDEED